MVEMDTIESQEIAGNEPQQPIPPQNGDDKLKALHNAVSKDYNIGSFEDFKKNLQDPGKRKSFYETVGKDYDLGKYEDFESKVSGQTTQPVEKEATIEDIRKNKDVFENPVPSTTQTADPMSGGSITTPGTSPEEIKAAKDQFDAQTKGLSDKWGIEPDKVQKALADFPNENDPVRLQAKAQLQKDNPESYSKLVAADENMHLLAKNGGNGVAHAYNELQGTPEQPINTLSELTRNISLQRDMINSNLSGSERQRALDNLEKNRSSAFNATSPEVMNEYSGNDELKGELNAMQFAGLKSIQAFDPNKYKLYTSLLAKRDDTNDDTVEQKIGLEQVKKELLDIGRKNTFNYLNEQQYDLNNAHSKATTDEQKAPLEEAWLRNKGLVDQMDQDAKKDEGRFPYLKDLEFEKQAKELSGSPDNGVISYALNKFGRGVGNAVKSVQNIDVNTFGTDQDIAEHNLERLGETEQEKNQLYLPEEYKSEGSPFVYKFDKPLQDQATKIKNDKSLTDDERNQKLIDLVKGNQYLVHTVTNTDKYGKSASIFSKATLYKNAGMIGDLASFAAQQAGMGGAGLPKWIASAAPMFIATQNDFYKQALEEGRPNPMEYANTHAAIMMAAGAINPDLGIVKRSLGTNTELGKVIAGVSENTWNDAIKGNKSLITKIQNSLLGAGKEAAKMGLTYGAGTSIASDLVNKGLFGSNLSGDQIVDRAIKATKDITTSSIGLLGLHAISNFKSVSPEEKARVWELGDNPKLSMERLDDAVKEGEITTQVADQRKAVVKKVSKLIDSVPTEDAKGRPLTDQQRSNYLYNLLIKDKTDDIKSDLPEAQKEKLEAIKRSVDIDNNAILDPKSEKENLMQRKRELTDLLAPDAEGKSTLTPLEKKTHQTELDDINEKIDNINSPKTEINGQETKDANASETEGERQIGKPEDSGSNQAVAGPESSISVIKPGGIKQPETVTIKPQDNAVQKSSDEGLLQREPEQDGSAGSGRGQMEPGEQGAIPAGGGGQQPKEESQSSGQEKVNLDDLPFGHLPVGVAHEAQIDRSKAELNVLPPERGEGLTLKESIDRGKELLKDGADVGKIVSDFQKDKKVSSDIMATVRAAYNELAQKTNQAYDKFGAESPEAKAAFTEERSFYNNSVKPMQTEWSKIGVAQQGAVDIDTGTVMGLRRAYNEVSGKDFTPQQEAKAKELSDNVSKLTDQVDNLKKKLNDVINDSVEKKSGTFTEKTKKAADSFRKLKTKEFTFKDSNGNDIPIQKMGVSWNDLVEFGAKAIEKTGEIADGIAAIIDKAKDADWYKSLSSEDKDRFAKELEDHYSNIADKKTASRIKSLEKQLADLEGGNIKEKGPKREPTEREKEIQDHIFEAKNKLGLVKSKGMPEQPKTAIEPQKIAEKFVNKKDNKFTDNEGKEIWEHVKSNYLDKGTELPDAIKNTSTDLGITSEQVINAIGTPKGAKHVTSEMFKTQYERRKAINSARRFIANADKSGLQKAINKVPSFFFNLKTWGHGTVGNITHAGPNIFRPSVWKAYWPNVAKSFKLAYGTTGNYEKAITILKNSPNFDKWIESGLAADPTKAYDEYQLMGSPPKKTQASKAVQWLNETGTRGFSGLNFMRYDMAEMLYNRASDAAKSDPEFREHVAELVNHSTGHSEVKLPKALKVIAFAPGLELSRWQRMITDPAHAIKTFANWKSSTPAEQAAAKIVAQSAGEKMAMYGTLLAANAGLLHAVGSKQSVNISDPSKSDWLKFKFANRTLDVSGNLVSPYRLLYTLLGAAKDANVGSKKEVKRKPGDKEANALTQQARYKLSPVAGTATDLATGTDPMGNVLPWSNIKPSAGRHKLTWKEMISKEALPIPVAAGLEGYWDSMKKEGMPESQIEGIFNGLLLFGVEGFTGAKLQSDYSLEKKKK